mmetsp:Transcript_7929/g.18702  ORF Transcript_7929/g.18702 Transcript_7929/m.18702 type:complete len:559 (+) Transcript_7929:119-1795(+)
MQGGMARLLLVVALLHFCFGDSIAPDEDITCINFQEDWNNVVTEDGDAACAYTAIATEEGTSTPNALAQFCSRCGEASAWRKLSNMLLNEDYQTIDKSCDMDDPRTGKAKTATNLMLEMLDEFAGVCLTSETESSHFCHLEFVQIRDIYLNQAEWGGQATGEDGLPVSSEANITLQSPGGEDREAIGKEGGTRRSGERRDDIVAGEQGIIAEWPPHPFRDDRLNQQYICGICKEEAAALVLLMYPPSPRNESPTIPTLPPGPLPAAGVNSSSLEGKKRRVDKERGQADVDDGRGGDIQAGGMEGYQEGGLGDYDEEMPGTSIPPQSGIKWPDLGLEGEEREAYLKLLAQVREWCETAPDVVVPTSEGDSLPGPKPEGPGRGPVEDNEKGEDKQEAAETVTVAMSAVLKISEESFDAAARTTYKMVTAAAFDVSDHRVTIVSVLPVKSEGSLARRLLAGGGIEVATEIQVAKLVEDPTANPLTEAQMKTIQDSMEAQLDEQGLKESWGLELREMGWKPEEEVSVPDPKPRGAAGVRRMEWITALAALGCGTLAARASLF